MEDTYLVLCSHGHFAKELVKSAEMIIGNLNDVIVFSLLPGESMEEFREQIHLRLQALGKNKKFLCLVDLYGGTPSTTVLSLMKDYPIDVVTGLNLAMLIEVHTAMKMHVDISYVDVAYDTLIASGKKIKCEQLI